MKPLKPLLRLFRRLSPEYLFLALLAVLLTAVALLWFDGSYWAILPLTLAVGMVLALWWDKRTAPVPWGRVLWPIFFALLLIAGMVAYFGWYYFALGIGVVAWIYGAALSYKINE